MPFRSLSASVSLNTRAASPARSSAPSAVRTPGPNRSAMAARTGWPGSWTSRTMASASTITAPLQGQQLRHRRLARTDAAGQSRPGSSSRDHSEDLACGTGTLDVRTRTRRRRPVRPAAAASGDAPAIAWRLAWSDVAPATGHPQSARSRRNAEARSRCRTARPSSAGPGRPPRRWRRSAGWPSASAWWWPGRPRPRPASASSFGAIVLIAYAAYRTWQPIPYIDDRSTALPLLFEFALATFVVLLTGAWSSPFTFSLLPPAMLRRLQPGLGVRRPPHRRVRRDRERQHLLIDADQRVRRRAGLRRLAGRHLVRRRRQRRRPGRCRGSRPASSRSPSTASGGSPRPTPCCSPSTGWPRRCRRRSTSTRCSTPRSAACATSSSSTASTVLLYEESDGSWVPVRRKGNRDQADPRRRDAARALQRALLSPGHRPRARPAQLGRPGPRAPGGVGPLLLAAVARRPDRPDRRRVRPRPTATAPRTLELLNGLVEPLGVAIDNARLVLPPAHHRRRRGAQPHRPRPPRPHRPVPRLPRLRARPCRPCHRAQRRRSSRCSSSLRDQVRAVVKEVRETLYDLRTDVSDVAGRRRTPCSDFCDRVHERSEPRHQASTGTRRAACRSCRSGSCGGSPRRRSSTPSATPKASTLTITLAVRRQATPS